jgi:ribulose-5-phosphate 4-epimerase/fuculose-1-phosphate aldolase
MALAAKELPALDFGCGGLIARAVRMINHAGCMDMNGHVSMRDHEDPNMMWINSRKASRSSLTARDVVPVDLRTGKRIGIGDEPPSEFHIHREIYLRRTDVAAVEHSHPEHIVTLSIAGKPLQPVFAVGAFLPENVPIFPHAYLIDTVERGKAVALALGEGTAVTLRGHGFVIAGPSVEHMVNWIVSAEDNAKAQFNALQIGEPHVFRGEELEIMRAQIADPKIVRKNWDYHYETARRAGALDGVDG